MISTLILPWMWEVRLALLVVLIAILLRLWFITPDFWRRPTVWLMIALLIMSLVLGWLNFCKANKIPVASVRFGETNTYHARRHPKASRRN
jgi:hypothetical protein